MSAMFFDRDTYLQAGEFDKLTVVEIRSCQDVGFEKKQKHTPH